MDKYFSDEDCRETPTRLQEILVENHEDIGEHTDIKYHKDGQTVFFKCTDGWVAIVPNICPN